MIELCAMTELITFILLQTAAVMSPGPDFVLVSRNALNTSRQNGCFTALGIAIGTLIHTTYCTLGIALTISESTWLLHALKIIGGGYFIYIGLYIVQGKVTSVSSSNEKQQTAWQAFKEGLWCNLLNPKATLFFLTLFGVFLTPSTAPLTQAMYIAVIFSITIIWFCLLSVFFTTPVMQRFYAQYGPYIFYALGGFVILFGVHLIFRSLSA